MPRRLKAEKRPTNVRFVPSTLENHDTRGDDARKAVDLSHLSFWRCRPACLWPTRSIPPTCM